jgi:4,5-DOPA dioxygenase extradiol
VTLVEALFVPNAPNLIAPEIFGGEGAETVRALVGLDLERRSRPDVILVATPHWVAPNRFLVQASQRPAQLYDFAGLPDPLFQVKYAPPGDPDLAHRLVARGLERKIPAASTTAWGLDHGAWSPLMHLAPEGRVPVVPLSITQGSPADHLAWGQAIANLVEDSAQRVVLVATGSITHAFARMQPRSAAGWPEGIRIEREIIDLILQRRYDEVAHFDPRKWSLIEPEGGMAPFFILAGAIGKTFEPRLVSTSQMWGAFGLTILDFAPSEGRAANTRGGGAETSRPGIEPGAP